MLLSRIFSSSLFIRVNRSCHPRPDSAFLFEGRLLYIYVSGEDNPNTPDHLPFGGAAKVTIHHEEGDLSQGDSSET